MFIRRTTFGDRLSVAQTVAVTWRGECVERLDGTTASLLGLVQLIPVKWNPDRKIAAVSSWLLRWPASGQSTFLHFQRGAGAVASTCKVKPTQFLSPNTDFWDTVAGC